MFDMYSNIMFTCNVIQLNKHNSSEKLLIILNLIYNKPCIFGTTGDPRPVQPSVEQDKEPLGDVKHLTAFNAGVECG
jgi:hypothetical protein